VLEDTRRFICGRRFTEYRAKMYFRLENKRIKRKVQKIGSRKNKQVESLQERKDVRNSMDRPEKLTNVKCGPALVRKNQSTDKNSTSFKPMRQPNHKNRRRRRRFAPLQKSLSSNSTVQQQGKESVKVPSELLSRFPNALQEINRRIMGQNFMWFLLS